MDVIDTGSYGAKVQSWRGANPRDLLKRTIEDYPNSDQASLLTKFRDRLRDMDGDVYFDSIVEYWFTNNYRSLQERPAPPPPAIASARVAEIKGRISTVIETRAKELLLDMQMPNGKPLRDCTFGYVAKLGGGLSRISQKGKPSEIVGSVLSEAEAAKLYRA